MRKSLSKRSVIYACVCIAFCTAAFALQPTVRAGSVSLNSSIKPITPTIAQTDVSASDTSANRGAALFKFGKNTVPAATQTTNNNNSGGSGNAGSGSGGTTNTTLAELQRQIEDLRNAQTSLEQTQTDLEQSQITTETLASAIAEQVKNLDLTTTNTDLKNTLSEIKSTNTNLQTSLNSVQQQAEALGDSLNSNIDSRLQYRGLLDSGNNLAFATKNEINPETLALRIAANPTATATLSEKITPKETDIQRIIRDDLIERQILDNTGNLNVEKKGQVQVTEATVTNALNNSTTFKNMVSQAATEKGFLTNDSDTIQNLATKDAITADAIATKIASSATAKQTLSGQIGPDENSVKNLIVSDLKKRGIVSNDNDETLQLLKTNDLENKLNEQNVITTNNMNAKLSGFAKTSDLSTLATKSEVTTLANKAITTENKNAMLSDFVKNADITPEILAAQIASSATARQTLSGQIGPNEESVKNLIVTDLKRRGIVSDDNEETLQLLKTADLDTKLAAKNFATSADISGLTSRTSALENAVTATELERTLQNKFATKNSFDTLSDNVSTISGDLGNISATINKLDGDENTTGSIANKIKSAKIITEDNITNKLPDNVVTTDNMNTKLTTFAKTTDITPEKLATEIASNPDATATLSNKITPKKTDIQRIIQEDLIDRQILDNNGDLNVEKKGQVQVTEDTVTNALNNSTTFKSLVSQAATEQGFLTDNSNTIKNLATKDSVNALSATVNTLNDDETNTNSVAYKIKALSDKLEGDENTSGSIANKLKTANVITDANFDAKITAKNLATKEDISADNLKTTLGDTYTKKADLSGLVIADLKSKDILKNDGTLNVTIDESTVTSALASSSTLGNMIDEAVSNKGYLTSTDTKSLATKSELADYAKTADLLDSNNKLKVALPDSVITTNNMNDKLTGFAKTDDLTAAKLGATLDSRYASANSVSKTNLVNTLGDSFATPDALTGFLTDSDLTAERLSGKLGKTYLTDNDLTASKLSGKLTGLYASADSVNKTNLINTLGNAYASSSDVNNLIATGLSNRGIISIKDGTETLNVLTPATLDANLPNTVVRSDALTNTLKSYATNDSISKTNLINTLGNAYANSSDVNNLIATGLSNRGIISVKDGTETLNVLTPTTLGAELTKNNVVTDSALTTRLGNYATTASLSAEELGKTLDSRYASSSSVTPANLASALSNTFASKTSVDTLLADASTTGSIANRIAATLDGDANTTGSFANRLAGAGVITTGNIGSTDIVDALNTAGLARSTEIATTVNNTLNGDANTTGSFANRLAGAGAITTDNIGSTDVVNALNTAGLARSTEIATTVNNTLNGDVNTTGSFANRLAGAGAITTGNIGSTDVVNALNTAGLAKTSEVVTNNNFATKLASADAQTTLTNAGFATKSNIVSDVREGVFTLADFSALLSDGGLVVDDKGKLKLADTSKSTAAANVASKLTSAQNAGDTGIQTTNITTTTNITNSIASVAASSADEAKTEEACNKLEYTFWNGSKCSQCPDGTYFDKTSATRCVCKEQAETFSTSTGKCTKDSMAPSSCIGNNLPGYYWTGSTCEKCPTGTHFNEASMKDTSLPRCLCDNETLEFSTSSGKCVQPSSCFASGQVTNPKGGCIKCPNEWPFIKTSSTTGTCSCPASTAFNVYTMGCLPCETAGAEYNENTKSCSCPAGSSLNQEQWKCTK